jgi:hypothetical protein
VELSLEEQQEFAGHPILEVEDARKHAKLRQCVQGIRQGLSCRRVERVALVNGEYVAAGGPVKLHVVHHRLATSSSHTTELKVAKISPYVPV